MKIQFLNGPYQGESFPVKKGLILSRKKRKKQDIEILDSKASTPHAEIIKKKELYYLKDLNSKNGIYVRRRRQKLLLLKIQTKFFIGETGFEVVEKQLFSGKNWQNSLIKELKPARLTLKNKAQELLPIDPLLELTFLSGVQKGLKWFVAYGPRVAGTKSIDLPVLESSLPARCFSLKPSSSGGVVFKTSHPKKVLLNKKSVQEKQLKTGDKIYFGNACLKAKFLKK